MESAKAFQNLVRKFFFNRMRNVENRENFPITDEPLSVSDKREKVSIKI